MNNISVIIPTMWIPETFEEQLNDLVHFVDDIIIINNNVKITPTWDILKNQTIRVFDQPENIYVNPAWNLGVEQAKNDTLCLLNDDILFNYYILDRVEDFKHIAPDYGIIGLHMMSKFNSSVSLIPTDVRCWGFGCMMFLDKSSYHVIPEELKILYGDDYLFDKNKMNGKQNYLLCGLPNNRVVSRTCCDEINTENPKLGEISKIEHEYYAKLSW